MPPPRQGGALPSELQPHHIILLILFAISLFRKSFSSSCSPIFKGSLQYIVVYIPTCNYYCELCIHEVALIVRVRLFFFKHRAHVCRPTLFVSTKVFLSIPVFSLCNNTVIYCFLIRTSRVNAKLHFLVQSANYLYWI